MRIDADRRSLRPAAAQPAACRSPTAATCAATTACRRPTTSGCRARALLTFEEIAALADVFADSASTACGSPAASRCCGAICRRSIAALAARPAVRDLALTTNGVLLERRPRRCATPGLHRITVSLDTLTAIASSADAVRRARRGARRHRRRRARRLRRAQDRHRRDARRQRRRAGRRCSSTAASVGAEVRFIEYMDVGGATHWSPDAVVSRREMLDALEAHYGPIAPLGEHVVGAGGSLRAARRHWRSASSRRRPSRSARTCDRSRLTADGVWLMCLYAQAGTDSAASAARGRLARGAASG